jgi:hypothetical protein
MKTRIIIAFVVLGVTVILLFLTWKLFRPKQYIFVCNDAQASNWQVKINDDVVATPSFASVDATNAKTMKRCQKITLPLSMTGATVSFTKKTGTETTQGSEVVDFSKNSYVYAHVASNIIWITQSRELIPSLAQD